MDSRARFKHCRDELLTSELVAAGLQTRSRFTFAPRDNMALPAGGSLRSKNNFAALGVAAFQCGSSIFRQNLLFAFLS